MKVTTRMGRGSILVPVMKRIFHILLIALCVSAVRLPAQESTTSWWERPLIVAATSPDGDALLEAALLREKAHGMLDSAVVEYRLILSLHEQHRVDAATATRARARLRYLQAAGLVSFQPIPSESVPEAESTQRLIRVAERLQLGRIQSAVANLSGGGGQIDPLQKRRRWLHRALQMHGDSRRTPSAPTVLAAIEQGVEAVRSALGLRGVAYYVESQLRQDRQRSMTPHERLLAALWAEKEHGDTKSAARHYRELVQLNLTSGIVSRLSERARQGLARCQQWQRAITAGS